MRYSSEWKSTVERTGRWIDFENDYKTLYPWYMESIWAVWAKMNDLGLIYRGFKVMPYSTACSTPLSNFEINDTYAPYKDWAITVTFPVKGNDDVGADGACFLAWTTTPWTLPSNLALCVHPEFDYVKVKDNKTGNIYIMLKERLCHVFPEPKKKGGKKKDSFKTLNNCLCGLLPFLSIFWTKKGVCSNVFS